MACDRLQSKSVPVAEKDEAKPDDVAPPTIHPWTGFIVPHQQGVRKSVCSHEETAMERREQDHTAGCFHSRSALEEVPGKVTCLPCPHRVQKVTPGATGTALDTYRGIA